MAYGAVGCLELTTERLLKSSHISIVQNSSPQIINLLYEEILSLKEALREFNTRRSTINMKMVKTLEAEIIEAIYEFEDVFDSHLANQFYSQSEEETGDPPLMTFSVDLQELKQDVDSFVERMNKMKKAYIHELCNPSPEEDDCVGPSPRIDFGGNDDYNMVGISDLFTEIKDLFGENSSQSEGILTVSLVGMAGIGKTTLAKKLFQDPSIFSCYTRHVFVTIGPKYRLADILVDILTQLNNLDIDEVILLMKGAKLLVELKRMVFKSLRFLRYLIVLDDLWDIELYFDLTKSFRDDNNGSRVLLTTRTEEVGYCASIWRDYNLRFLDKKESWELLRHKVFGEEEPCSYGLEKAGKKIAENCEGLPLTIITVANILSKADKTIEYWNEVADDKQNSVYKDAYDQMSKVLYPSYDYLEQHLKAFFLYLGAFPQNYSVYGYQMVNLCGAEGFLNPRPIHYSDPIATFENNSYGYLNELCFKNVIMSAKEERGFHLHSSFWYLCNKEAPKNNFYYALNFCADALQEEGIEYQRRLCIRNSVLFAIEDVQDSIASASKVRSLLCTGPYHQYPVPLCLDDLRLLRVFHARSIRFYEFPMEVMKLVQLRYLALVYNGNLPPSISKLLNLQCLIVDRHLSIVKSCGNLLPIEIWNMKELKYLQTTGRDLPHPCDEESVLPNLLELTRATHQSCNKDVLERIPNLEILDIQIELALDAFEPLSCFDHISCLRRLTLLKCVVVNPIFKAEVVIAPFVPLSDFPSSLTKLILKGLGYPWEELRKISSLPNLVFLLLECYAFRGPKWEVRDNEFLKLSHLHIEDTDLEQWKFVESENSCLPMIYSIRILHCYKLKELPLTFGRFLEKIDLVDCNPMAEKCANTLKKEWDDKYGVHGRRPLLLDVRSSL
ncbi:hypothetical protein ACP275_04G177000 [Erythranthe tilingii]